MRKILCVFGILVLVPITVMAQEQNYRGQGYVFAAPGAVISGGSAATIHFGGGGEFNIYKGLGFGSEIGYLSTFRDISSGVGVFSATEGTVGTEVYGVSRFFREFCWLGRGIPRHQLESVLLLRMRTRSTEPIGFQECLAPTRAMYPRQVLP